MKIKKQSVLTTIIVICLLSALWIGGTGEKVTAQESQATEKSFGQVFFDEHLEYIFSGDLDGMIDAQYAEDAVLISPFDCLPDAKPPHVIQGRAALKEFFQKYAEWQGELDVESVYFFADTEDVIQFQAIFTSDTGKWVVGDGWYLEDGLIVYHASFAHKIGEGRGEGK